MMGLLDYINQTTPSAPPLIQTAPQAQPCLPANNVSSHQRHGAPGAAL